MSALSDRQPYKSELSDERWALIEPVITAWKARHRGHQGNYDMREIVNALLYQSRTGCQWDYLPPRPAPTGAVKYYFYKCCDNGTDQTIHDLLRRQVREKRGRLADPAWWCSISRACTPPDSRPTRPAGTRTRRYRDARGDWPLTCWAW